MPHPLRLTGHATITSVQTSSSGASFVAFGSSPCTALDIVNNTGTAIEYRRDGAGLAIRIADGSSRMVFVRGNANEIEVRRVDQSNTQVTLTAEAITAY